MFRGGTVQRWGAGLALSLCLGGIAIANPDEAASRFPATTELFFTGKVLPGASTTLDLLDRFELNPAVEYMFDQTSRAGYETFKKDFLPWIDGHVTFAWVRTGDKSPLDAQEKREIQESAYGQLSGQLSELVEAVTAFKTRYKRLPKNWKELTDKKIVRTLPSSPQADFKLIKSGDSWSIQTVYKGSLNLQELIDAPTRSGPGIHYETKFKPRPALNMVFALKCSDIALARVGLAKLTENKYLTAVDSDHWQIPIEEISPWTVELETSSPSAAEKGGWLVASDNPELLKRYGAGPAVAAGSLLSNPHYQLQRKQLPTSQESGEIMFAFFDVDDLMKTTSSLAELPAISKVLGSLGLVAKHTVSSASELPSSSYSEAFLELQSSGNVTLFTPNAPATNSTVTSASSWDFLKDVPAQTSIVYGVNLSESLNLLQAAGKWDPDVETLWSGLYGQVQKALASDISQADLARSTGWVVVQTEIFDQFFSGFNEARAMFSGGEKEPAGDANALLVRQLSRLPLSWSMQIFDAALEDKLGAALWTALGDKGAVRTAGPLQYWLRGDGAWVMARLPQRLEATGKISKRLFLRDLDCAAGKEASLNDLASMRDFQSHVHGRMLLFTHQKVDWLYSILKGILLTVDSQTRPEADVLGHYRDSYEALTVEPLGVRAFAAFYSADGMPGAPVSPPAKDLVLLHDQIAHDFSASHQAEAAASNPGSGGFAGARAQGQLTACKSNLKNIGTALEMYSTDNAGRYPKNLKLLTPNYLRTIPICPAAGRDTYSARYRWGVKPDSYSVYCSGRNHADCGVPAQRPAYNSQLGLIVK